MWTYLENYFNLKKSFVFYGSYHHEWRNQLVHVVFVPILFTTALAFASTIKITDKVNVSQVVAGFYAVSFIIMEPVAGLLYAPLIGAMQYVGQNICTQNLGLSAVVHVCGWAAQVLAHKFFEHRAPAVTEDPLQAVHAAVFFVWLEVLYALGYRRKERDELDGLTQKRIAKMNASEAAAKVAPA